MFNLANLTFLAPWALSALLILPLLWHLLKVTPPKPTIIRFPAVRLLQELTTDQVLATRTPWWVLILRSLIAICLILALSQPIWNASQHFSEEKRPYIVIVDNGWSMMDHWHERHDDVLHLLDNLKRANQPTLLVASANDAVLRFGSIDRAMEQANALKAQPWAPNRDRTLQRLNEALSSIDAAPKIFYFSNGLKDEDDTFLSELSGLGSVEIFNSGLHRLPAVIYDLKRSEDAFSITLHHPDRSQEKESSINLVDDQGRTLYKQTFQLSQDSDKTSVNLVFPTELRRKASRLHIAGTQTPASQYILDERWRDRPVGLISNGKPDKTLLSPTYYVQKSLRPYAPIQIADLSHLLTRDMAVLIDTEDIKFSATQLKEIEQWVSAGGILIRFASEKMAERQGDPLLPVNLMRGQRTLEGTLSWKRPASLAEFGQSSPFRGLSVPNDIKVKKQVLAKPENNLSQKTWAQLKDGTPLITAKSIDSGWSVLFHITPIPGWSNLPLSGMFEMMMIRLLNLSAGNSPSDENIELPPYRLFDDTGILVPPYGNTLSIKASDLKNNAPSEQTPPGLYGHGTSLHAFNLGPSLHKIEPLTDLPPGVKESKLTRNNEVNLAPWALLAALCLLFVDWLASVTLTRAKTAIATGIFLLTSGLAPAQAETDWEQALAAANDMRLAYMITGDAKLDDTSKRGLNGLGIILKRRTAVELSPSMGFDPEKDDPSLYPMIYWPIDENQKDISDAAADRLNKFMQTGGFILFDTLGKKSTSTLSRLTDRLNIAGLRPIPTNHVLTRSFYLMQSFPGRYDHNEVWVEAAEDRSRDRVSSVLIGPNAWAQAWAKDDSLRPLYAVVPGGEVQREYAYRFGVNLVMYILSGNYKGDQVHLPAIMQRLGL